MANGSRKDLLFTDKAKSFTGKRGRPKKSQSLTMRMREVLDHKCTSVDIAREYCEAAGLDPRKATVLDALVHCQLLQAFRGNHNHMRDIWERIDGKVPVKATIEASGKLGISEAMAAMKLAYSSDGTRLLEQSDDDIDIDSQIMEGLE